MGKRIFEVVLSTTVKIELDDAVIDVVDDAWREELYNLHTPEQIAGHIARNLWRGGGCIELQDLDGWADQPNDNAKLLHEGTVDVEECTEIEE